MDLVLLCSPPSSPAAYAHLAGRTGRNGREGLAVTILRKARDARRVRGLSEALGAGFVGVDVDEDVDDDDDDKGIWEEEEGEVMCTEHLGGEGDENDGSALRTAAVAAVVVDVNDSRPPPPLTNVWSTKSRSTLNRKTVVEIREYLTDRVSLKGFAFLFLFFWAPCVH